jgi:DNA-binding transcriptional LysR family regulator
VRWLLCAAAEYLRERGVPLHPRELAHHDCIHLGETADDNRWRLRRGTQTHSVDVSGRYIANHAGARLEAAMKDFGIAALPEFAATDALQSGALIQVLADWTLEARAYVGSIWLLYPPNRFLPPKVRALIDYLAEHIHDPP